MKITAAVAYIILLSSSTLVAASWKPSPSALTSHGRPYDKATALLETKALNDRLSTRIPLPMIPHGGASPQTDVEKAKAAFIVDGVLALASLAFLGVWLFKSEKFFSPYLLKNGFCNSATFPTQKSCAFFDWIVAALSLVTAMKHGLKSPAVIGNGVLYPIVHGAAHFLFSKGKIDPTDKIHTPLQIGILAIILAVGPLGVVTQLNAKGWDDKVKLGGVFFGLDTLITWIFVSKIKQGGLALLYINVVINLMLFVSRVLLWNPFTADADGEKAVKFYNDTFGPRVLTQLASIAFMVIVMWIEPTQCGMIPPGNEGWFAKIGGHIWFDISLFFMAWTSLQNAIALKEPGVTKAFFY